MKPLSARRQPAITLPFQAVTESPWYIQEYGDIGLFCHVTLWIDLEASGDPYPLELSVDSGASYSVINAGRLPPHFPLPEASLQFPLSTLSLGGTGPINVCAG